MPDGWFAVAEMLLVFGGVLGFAVWQIVSVNRASREDRRRRDEDNRR
jgi:hypothetical protein